MKQVSIVGRVYAMLGIMRILADVLDVAQQMPLSILRNRITEVAAHSDVHARYSLTIQFRHGKTAEQDETVPVNDVAL